MILSELIKKLNELLKIQDFEDPSNNGLQVGREKQIKKVGLAVDATIETFQKAKQKNCDLLITHHGISWNDNLSTITGSNYERIKFLVENDLALAAYHLPLDAHDEYGNNIKLANLLSLNKVTSKSLLVSGEILQVSFKELQEKLNTLLNTKCTGYNYGTSQIRKVSIVTGSGSSFLEDSTKHSDCLITGDERYGTKSLAKELSANIIFAGHYQTETLGVKALIPLLTSFEIECIFIHAD